MNQIQRLFLATAAGAATVALPAQDGASSFGDARTRELAELGRLPTPADVVVADIVNYHRHRLPLPRAGDLVALDLRFGAATIGPHGEAVLQIGYTTTPTADRQDLPPLNLGLVIDCSGSMQDQGKMDQVQRGLALMVDRLRPGDRVALVAYDDEARLERASQVLGDGRWLRRAIQDLHPGGSTNLHAGLMLGLHEVQEHQRQGGSNRVILLTDGIANRGVVDPERILDDARTVVGHGIDLSTIGVGRDLNTDLLDKLARGGHGLFHFVADGKDLQKVFVDELDALMAPVARNVRLSVVLPSGLRLQRVYGHQVVPGAGDDSRRQQHAFTIELPDLNRGLTAVVMATCTVDPELRAGTVLQVHAELDYRDAARGQNHDCSGEASITVDPRGEELLTDGEVRKNFTIATLAQALRDMADRSQQQRWADADRVLRAALRFAQAQFPNAEDADLRRVVEMAEGHLRTLQRYVDRHRDF